MVTNKYVYNIDKHESDHSKVIKRKIELDRLHALTEGTDCGEFILHVQGEYDYQFITKSAKMIIEVISYAYSNVTNKSLSLFEVPGKSKNLEKFVTSKDEARIKIDKLPDDDFRVKRDDELIIRQSVKVINSKNHGKEWEKMYKNQVMTPMGPGDVILKDPKKREEEKVEDDRWNKRKYYY